MSGEERVETAEGEPERRPDEDDAFLGGCWRAEPADRAAFLVDAADYFRVLAEVLEGARRSVWILGWDIHSRVGLVRDDAEGSDAEHELARLLDRVARERPGLEVRILCWDFAVIYALERESFPVFRLDWRTHERVRCHMDDRHPVGASHHQKIVVVDGVLAFVGGVDLTANRWDTPEHRPDDPRRTTPAGERYGPFHDVQAAVDGAAARAIEDLARERWERATDERIAATEPERDAWPASLRVDLRDVTVGIARTEPAHEGREEAREVERTYLDAIAAARRFVYLENQYFSSSRIGEALAERLAEPDGPEIVLVSPRRCSGWLEEVTVGVLRARLLAQLEEADAHGRLRAVCPVISMDAEVDLNVHSKVLVVDDRLARVGSANLSNRSMGLDTECDLLFPAANEVHAEAIAGFRNRLLAEHLGASPERVAERLAETGSLVETVDALSGGDRTLVPISSELEPWIDELVPEESVVDPESPVNAEELAERFLRESSEDGSRRPVRRAAWTLAALLGLAAIWRFTPLEDWLTPDRLAALFEPLREHPLGPAIVVAGFVVGSLAMFPVTLMIVGTALLYGTIEGGALALLGAVLAAVAGYAVGSMLWRDTVRRMGGRTLNRLSRLLARRGVAAMAVVRLVPVAPFTVVNLVAGASHLRFRDFVLGTVLAMAPGVAAMAWVSGRVAEAALDPDPWSVAGAVGAVVLLVGAGVALRRRFESYGIAPRESEARSKDAAS